MAKVEYAQGILDPPQIVWGGPGALASSWELKSLPSRDLNNNTATVFVGKVVGGCSAINGMFFDRGSRFDYDAWAKLQDHNPGTDGAGIIDWSWTAIYPFFKKSVTFTPPAEAVARRYNYTWDESVYGNTTLIYATLPPFQWADHYAARESWREMGIWVTDDCAGGNKEGLCWTPNSEDPVSGRRPMQELAITGM